MCVLLGFRGELARSRTLFGNGSRRPSRGPGRAMGKELPAIPETTPWSNVPLLLGSKDIGRWPGPWG